MRKSRDIDNPDLAVKRLGEDIPTLEEIAQKSTIPKLEKLYTYVAVNNEKAIGQE